MVARPSRQIGDRIGEAHDHFRGRPSSRLGRLHQASQVTEGEQPAFHRVSRFAVVFTGKLRHVIRSDWSVKSDVTVSTHGSDHVRWSIVVKGLGERFFGSANVAKMNISYVAPEPLDGCGHVNPHFRKGALAEADRVAGAGNQFNQALEVLDVVHDPRLSEQFRQRRIVRMHG